MSPLLSCIWNAEPGTGRTVGLPEGPVESASLANAERRKDFPKNIVGCRCSCNLADRIQGLAEIIKRKFFAHSLLVGSDSLPEVKVLAQPVKDLTYFLVSLAATLATTGFQPVSRFHLSFTPVLRTVVESLPTRTSFPRSRLRSVAQPLAL